MHDDPLLPDGLLEMLDDVGRSLPGRGYGDLAQAVAALSAVYTRARDRIEVLPGAVEALQARLRFFLPRDLPKIGGPLRELGRAGALPPGPRWKVLDLGAGLGTTTLGAAWFAARHARDVRGIDVTAIEHDPRALAIFEQLASRAPQLGLPALRLEGIRADLRRLDLDALESGYDLVLLGLVLNELGEPEGSVEAHADLLEGLTERLAPDGALIVLEPALRETSRHLHRVRDRVVEHASRAHLFAPCLHRGACPMLAGPKDWCHEELRVSLPPALAEVARAAGLRHETLTYAYLTLRRAEGTLRDALDPARPGTLLRVVSRPMPTKGKRELFGCGEGGRVRLMRLSREASAVNHPFEEVGRGDVLRVTGARPQGERLRVGPETHVERL